VKAITILGYGAVGRALTERLTASGRSVRVADRKAPVSLPEGANFVEIDMADVDAVRSACMGAVSVVCTLGLPYRPGLWAKMWPIFMANTIDAVSAAKARLVFADNLYMYGPQDEPLHEDMALTDFGEKPRVRAHITRMWMEAHAAGRIQAVAVRASDFYGPNAPNSVLAEFGVKPILEGRTAMLPIAIDHPHAFTYVPDFARALESLIHAPDEDYGQAWHVPNAPPQSMRMLIELAAELAGRTAKVAEMPGWLTALASFWTPALRAMAEMKFQTDRPYYVDHAKFAARFWDDPTPVETGLRETINAFLDARNAEP
jgi:nucleoside-diphosphate-sugar epimerase